MVKKYIPIILLGATLNAHAYTQDEHCLAIGIEQEATKGSMSDHIGVRDVILNRSKKSRLSVCSVLRKPRQFSFVTKHTKWTATERQLQIYDSVKNKPKLFGSDVLFFHRIDKHPAWAKKMKRVGQYGQHLYFKEK